MPRMPFSGSLARWLRASVLTCSLVTSLLGLAAGAGAAPMVEFPVPGTPNQRILQIEAGPGGVLWFLQSTGNDRVRLGLVRDDGTIEVFDALPGTVSRDWGLVIMHASPAGGAWTLHTDRPDAPQELTYTDATGRQSSSAAPPGAAFDFGVDAAGRAVLLACVGRSPCTAHAVAPGGESSAVPLPIVQLRSAQNRPDGPSIVRVAHGTWFMAAGRGGTVAFLADDGTVATVALNEIDRFGGPGPGNDVWLSDRSVIVDAQEPLPEPTRRTIVRVSLDGTRVPVTSPFVDMLEAWSPGGLAWFAWRLGFGLIEGRQVRLVKLALDVAAVPVGRRKDGGFAFSGRYGWSPSSLHRASDGAVWALTPGNPGGSRRDVSRRPQPSVITRLAPGGGITAFAPPSARRADGTVDARVQAVNMTASTTGALWFLITRRARSDRFARADPLSPPPSLLTWRRFQRRTAERRRTRALVGAQLARDIVPSQSWAGIEDTLDSNVIFRFDVRYRAPGRLRVSWHTTRRGSSLLIARAACPEAGLTVVGCELVPTSRGRELLSAVRRLKITVRGVFFLDGQRPVHVTRTATLQGLRAPRGA